MESFDSGATCNASLISKRTLHCIKNTYATLYIHYVLKLTAFFLIAGKLLFLFSDVFQPEVSCMTILTAVHFLMILCVYIMQSGSWLRQCCTRWKVLDVTPDGVIGLFYILGPCVPTMVVGLAKPLNRKYVPGISLGWGVLKAAGV
jgi:hypothetical protein